MLGKFPMDKVLKDPVNAYLTMLESDAGIMPRAIHHIFQGLQRQVQSILYFIKNMRQLLSMLVILVC